MRYLSAFRADIRQKLRDEFVATTTSEWKDDEIDVQIQQTLEELSRALPYETRESFYATEDSLDIDISTITNLLQIVKVECPIGTPIAFSTWGDWLTMEIDTAPADAAHGTLTGTITFTLGDKTVTGVGALFTTEIKSGDYIAKSTGTRWYTVESITSATELELTTGSFDTGADIASVTKYAEAPVYVYCHKIHTLDDDSSTLKPNQEELLIKGVCGQLAVNRAREMEDQVNIGGGGVSYQMQNWGLGELNYFRLGLKQTTRPSQKSKWAL